MTNYEPTLIFREIAARLRGRIARFDLNQADLAKICGVSQSQFSKIIRGTRPMTVDQLAAVCEALGLSIGQLVSEVEEFAQERLSGSSPVAYVEDDERLDKPSIRKPEWLDGFGREALTRFNVPATTDTQDDYERVARKRSKDRGEDLT